jgi:multicomponent Na+:H+ antiporter subunit E
MLTLNIFLAITWAAVSGELTVSNLLAGFLIGYGVLWVVSRPLGQMNYFAKVGQVTRFTVYFLWEMLVATLRVAVDIVTPQHLMRPAILAIPVRSESEAETTMLANVITLTPGTLSLDVSPDGKTLYVHVMYAQDVEAARQSIQDGFGTKVHEVFQ